MSVLLRLVAFVFFTLEAIVLGLQANLHAPWLIAGGLAAWVLATLIDGGLPFVVKKGE